MSTYLPIKKCVFDLVFDILFECLIEILFLTAKRVVSINQKPEQKPSKLPKVENSVKN